LNFLKYSNHRLYVAAYIVICIFIGVVSRERRIGGAGAFFISLFLTPIVGLIVVAVSKPKGSGPLSSPSYSGGTPIVVITTEGLNLSTTLGKIQDNALNIQKHPVSEKFEVRKWISMTKYSVKGAYITFAEAKQHMLVILNGQISMEISKY
jgi:hypothetical protein